MSLSAHILPCFLHIPRQNIPSDHEDDSEKNSSEHSTEIGATAVKNGEAGSTKQARASTSDTKLQMCRMIEQFDWLAKALAFRKEGSPFPSKGPSNLSVRFE